MCLLLIPQLSQTEGFFSAGSVKSPPRAAKLRKILGDDAPQAYIDKLNADFKKWYLWPDHAPEDLQTDPEGTVKGGMIQTLVKRLTTHDAPGQLFCLCVSCVPSVSLDNQGCFDTGDSAPTAGACPL